MATEVPTGAPAEIKKYQTYNLKVDPDDDDKATEIKLCSFARPHMRAFHWSWFSFFVAFFVWFAIAPLLPEIKKTLGLTKKELWTSNICSVASTILMRFIVGPGCDKFGPRIIFTIVLIYGAIPTACVGLINSATSLIILRLFIGVVGCTFVPCQFWTTRMFVKEVAGTANAMAGGWGNLGGGVTQLVMGTLLFPAFKRKMTAEKAWRTVCLVPAGMAALTGTGVYFLSDDAPKGNYKDMKKNGTMPEVSASASFRQGALNINSWILFIQYGCCFGVELTMNNAAALYFVQEFNQTTESAAAIASIFGWMNLFARGLGGFCSDKMNDKLGMRGRLYAQFFLLLVEGIMVFIFNRSKSLSAAIATMVFFSAFVQACEGSTYGIVPYVNPPATGSIAGIVGAGGNSGAVAFGMCFRQLSYKQAFDIMAASICGSALLTVLIFIKGQGNFFKGSAEPLKEQPATLTVPEPDKEAAADLQKE